MLRVFTTFALAAVLVAAGGSQAQDAKTDKKADGPAGVWTREAGGLELKFDFTDAKAGSLKLTVMNGDNGVVAGCKVEVKGGVVTAQIKDVEEKGNFPNKPPVGFEFSFKWKAAGDTAELSDLQGDNIDNVKPVVEGEYKRVKGKKE
ncbi:hypothetical protein [Urbifossiella limnaea]|uniref:Uncharacterized protein n=1 Tax=Urbifossiella limnaea TaxID=2528023 RepID=A0A517XWZ0_9BACT|nr:hypothetical protein [Urbifossiella limnaea]QDU22005.1 hypothetical protein ETAA1_39800 [Urbifossiella limnaea]